MKMIRLNNSTVNESVHVFKENNVENDSVNNKTNKMFLI